MNKLEEIEQINLSSSVLDSLEYNNMLHVYLYNGKIIPGVTQLVEMVFGDKYKGVPEKILRQASIKGTRMHECIEAIEEKGVLLDEDYQQEVVNYLGLMKKYELKPLKSEALVVYSNTEVYPSVVYAGRFDMLAENKKRELVLIDFKRMYKIDRKRVQLQLNLYAEGFSYTYGEDIKKLYCMRLREDKAEMMQLKRDKKVIEKVSNYYLHNFINL